MSHILNMDQLSFIKEEIQNIPGVTEKPKKNVALKYFLIRAVQALKLVVTEKEIIVFALLQWIIIGCAYFFWVQILDWIPEEVWRSTETSDQESIASIVMLLWSFIIVGIVALPIGILNACIGAVHFLRRQNRPSTIAACLQIVLPRAWPLWFFSWTDSWMTVRQILKRLPKKKRTENRAVSEALYYAWKLGTIAVLPALLSGRKLVDAGSDSVFIVKKKLVDTSLLRSGYSFICWIIGITTYLGTILFFNFFDTVIPTGDGAAHVYEFYFWAGVPIIVAVGCISLFLRPIYTLSSADLYSDYLQETNQPLLLPQPPSSLTSIIVALVVLLTIVMAVFFFRDSLGITDMLSTPFGEKYFK